MKVNKKFNRRYLVALSAYRRQVRERQELDFSYEAAVAQYKFETYGKGNPDPKTNGFTLGKKVLDITLAAMYEDHQSGITSKYELYQGSSALVRKVVKTFPSVRLFVYD